LLDRAAEMEVLAAMAGDGVVPMELTETQASEWSSMLKALEAAGNLDDDLTSAQAGDQYGGLVGDQYGLVGDGYGVTKPNGKPPFVPAPDPLQVAPGAVPQGIRPSARVQPPPRARRRTKKVQSPRPPGRTYRTVSWKPSTGIQGRAT
jgi:hypothetical protein